MKEFMEELGLYPTFTKDFKRPMWMSHSDVSVKVFVKTYSPKKVPNKKPTTSQVSHIKAIASKITSDFGVYLKYMSYGIEPALETIINLGHLPLGTAIFVASD
jgi:hypothetical protein